MQEEKPWGKEAVMSAIIAAATSLIAERGVAGVSIRDIAKAANVNHGLITRHFGSKDELIKTIGLNLVDSIFEDFQKKGYALHDILLAGLDDYSLNLRAIVRILLDDTDQKMSDGASSLLNKLLDWIKTEQSAARISPELEPMVVLVILASLVLGTELFSPYIKKLKNLSDKSFQELRPQIFQTVFTGLRGNS